MLEVLNIWFFCKFFSAMFIEAKNVTRSQPLNREILLLKVADKNVVVAF